MRLPNLKALLRTPIYNSSVVHCAMSSLLMHSPAASAHSGDVPEVRSSLKRARGSSREWTVTNKLQTREEFDKCIPCPRQYQRGNISNSKKQGVVQVYLCKEKGCPHKKKTVVDHLTVYESGKHIHGPERGLPKEQEKQEDGDTPLHMAAMEGHDSVVSLIISSGANVMDKDNLSYSKTYDGDTPVHDAASRGHESVVALLLKIGADVMAKGWDGWTPLHEAVVEGYDSVVSLLLSSGADVEAKDNVGYTPLHLAASRGHESVVALLLKSGADIMAQTKGGGTPLHIAAMKGYDSVTSLLLSSGADVMAKTNAGKTPLDLAVDFRKTSTAALLRSHI